MKTILSLFALHCMTPLRYAQGIFESLFSYCFTKFNFPNQQLKFFKVCFFILIMMLLWNMIDMIIGGCVYLFSPTHPLPHLVQFLLDPLFKTAKNTSNHFTLLPSWIDFKWISFGIIVLLFIFSRIFYRVSKKAHQNQPEILNGVITHHHAKIEILREKQHLQNSLPKALHQPKHSRL